MSGVKELRTENADLRKKNNWLTSKNLILEERLKLLEAKGAKHTTLNPGEMVLPFMGDLPPVEPPEFLGEAPDGETAEDVIKKRHRGKSRPKRIDTSNLERRKVVHELEPEERFCPDTKVPLVPIGEKVTEELEYEAAKYFIVEHCQIEYGPSPKIASERKIETQLAPMPLRPLEGCLAGATLLAWLLTSKYKYHLPLYRLETMLTDRGMQIPRARLCDWVLDAAFLMKPIVDALLDSIRAGPVRQLDDTPVRCQGKKGQGNFTAYLWTYVNPEVEGVAYVFSEGRGSKHITAVLEGSTGYLVGDAYSGQQKAAKDIGNLHLCGCWAHAFRYFRDALEEDRPRITRMLKLVGKLFDLEEAADKEGISVEERLERRNQMDPAILESIFQEVDAWNADPNRDEASGRAKAYRYLHNQREAMTRFLEDGRIPIHNNACELAIRCLALGRKNWLFAGSIRGGDAAAIIFSLVESCKIAGICVEEYLADALVRVRHHPKSKMAELIPAEWGKRFAPVVQSIPA